jgi:hypothetical protein
MEYSKTFDTPAGLLSAAEVLRERTLDTDVITARAATILQLAEQVVRREAERREAERRELERSELERRKARRVIESPEAKGRTMAAPSDLLFDARESLQAP